MTEAAPLVSVVIPSYNRAGLIGKTIDSVLNQDYPNIEIIVVDDCSSDDTESVIAGYGDRVIFRRHDENKGAPAARNTGLEISRGKYIAFLDSDDTWTYNKISAQMDVMISSDSGTALVYCGMVKIDGNGNVVGEKIPKYRGRIYLKLLKDNVIGSTSVPLILKDAVMEVGGFDESLPSRQDLDLWLRLAKRWTVDYDPGKFVNYYVHENRISSDIEGKIKGNLMILDKYYDDIKKHPSILSSQYEVIGWLYKKNGQIKEARKYFIRSLKSFPNIKSLYHLLKLYLPFKD